MVRTWPTRKHTNGCCLYGNRAAAQVMELDFSRGHDGVILCKQLARSLFV